MNLTEKLQKFEKYFRRLDFGYYGSKKNMVFKFHEIFEEEMKETPTGKKWREKIYGKEQVRLDNITKEVRKLRKEVESNPKLKKKLERYEDMLGSKMEHRQFILLHERRRA
jgi:peptide methionine sulfoxide reductase MsrA